MNPVRLLPVFLLACVASGCGVDRSKAVDELFAAYSGDVPGASVLVIRDGEKILAKNYGLANVESQTAVTSETNFRLASVTKQFTATAVLMLVERGELALDDPVRMYFPELPAFTEGITIRQLLNHTSGIEDYEPLYELELPNQVTDAGVADILAGTEGTYFPPGTDYRYSNSAYALLSQLVERLSGQTFGAFLDQNIFSPLGMSNTVAHVDGVTTVPNRAFGYTVEDGVVEPSDQSPWSAVLGDGGVYSSVNELYLWDQAQYEGGLLSPDLRALSETPGLEDYGFGLRIDTYKGHRRIHHSGSTSGFRNFMQRFPDARLSVIVLTNRAAPDVQPLAEQVADLYL